MRCPLSQPGPSAQRVLPACSQVLQRCADGQQAPAVSPDLLDDSSGHQVRPRCLHLQQGDQDAIRFRGLPDLGAESAQFLEDPHREAQPSGGCRRPSPALDLDLRGLPHAPRHRCDDPRRRILIRGLQGHCCADGICSVPQRDRRRGDQVGNRRFFPLDNGHSTGRVVGRRPPPASAGGERNRGPGGAG